MLERKQEEYSSHGPWHYIFLTLLLSANASNLLRLPPSATLSEAPLSKPFVCVYQKVFFFLSLCGVFKRLLSCYVCAFVRISLVSICTVTVDEATTSAQLKSHKNILESSGCRRVDLLLIYTEFRHYLQG